MASAPSSTTPNNATAYINGRVYTVDQGQPWAEAFIVSPAGTFSAVGSTDEILAKARQDKLVVYDLESKFIMPGIHDAHVHTLVSGLSQLSSANLGLEGSIPAPEAEDRLRAAACGCRYAHAFGHWLSGDVFRIDDYDRSWIDEAYPQTPVMITAAAGHSLLLNTAALQESGYDIANEPPAKGSYLGRRPDGSLTGEVAEIGMTKAILSRPKPSLSHVKRALRYAVGQLHKAGVTSCQEASANTPMVQALGELDAANELKIDMYTHIVYAPEFLGEEPADRLHALLDSAASLETRHVKTQFVKMMLDGVPLAPMFTQAGLDAKGEVEEDKICVDDVVEAVARYDARGMTCKIHCTGQGATRRALDAIAAARKRNAHGPRHEIAHCSGVHDDDYPRFRQLKTTAEMSPSAFFTQAFGAREEALQDWNFGRMRQHGAHMTIGSDWGATAAPSVLPGVEGVVGGAGGAAAVLRMLTLAGAEAVGREAETGSISVGKRANFIQLDRDLSAGRAGAFGEARVERTWFEGEVVYEHVHVCCEGGRGEA